MREKLLEYAKRGVITKAEIAEAARCPVSRVDRLRRAKVISPIEALGRPFVFDPVHIADVLCPDLKQVRSLTTEKRISSGNPKGKGFRKCL